MGDEVKVSRLSANNEALSGLEEAVKHLEHLVFANFCGEKEGEIPGETVWNPFAFVGEA